MHRGIECHVSYFNFFQRCANFEPVLVNRMELHEASRSTWNLVKKPVKAKDLMMFTWHAVAECAFSNKTSMTPILSNILPQMALCTKKEVSSKIFRMNEKGKILLADVRLTPKNHDAKCRNISKSVYTDRRVIVFHSFGKIFPNQSLMFRKAKVSKDVSDLIKLCVTLMNIFET